MDTEMNRIDVGDFDQDSKGLLESVVGICNGCFRSEPGLNYIVLGFGENEEFEMTISRPGYRTPHQKRVEAEQESELRRQKSIMLESELACARARIRDLENGR
jgi:hypothetical protein